MLRLVPGSSFQSNSLEVIDGVLQCRQQRFRFACYLHFPNDPARIVHNADARLLDRHVEASKIVHAALLLLMLEAALRTSFHHQPEAQHPKSSAIHSRRPITPSSGPKADMSSSGLLPCKTDP